jgi:hypothetical protein
MGQYCTNAILANTNYFFLNFNFSTATHRRSERLTFLIPEPVRILDASWQEVE